MVAVTGGRQTHQTNDKSTDIWRFPELGVTPKSSILMVVSIINYKPSIWGYPHLWKPPFRKPRQRPKSTVYSCQVKGDWTQHINSSTSTPPPQCWAISPGGWQHWTTPGASMGVNSGSALASWSFWLPANAFPACFAVHESEAKNSSTCRGTV